MTVYLKLENLSGDVEARYKGWIQLESVSFGPENAGLASSSGTGRPGKSSTTTTVSATVRRTGGVSVELHHAAVTGIQLGIAIIVLDTGQPGGTRGFVMKDTLISGYHIGGGHGDVTPVDDFSLEGVDLRLLTEAQLGEILKAPAPPASRRRGR